MQYRIYDGETKLFWSNEDGWGSLQNSTHFTEEESKTLSLPVGGPQIRWLSVDEIYPFGAGDHLNMELWDYVAWDVLFDVSQPLEGYLDSPPESVDPKTIWTVYEDETCGTEALIARAGVSWHHGNVLGFITSTETWEAEGKEFIYFHGRMDD